MTTTAHDIATVIHYRHGVDLDFAVETVETYIARMEDVDDREIDRDDIPENDADFIINAFASAYRNYNLRFGVVIKSESSFHVA